MEVQVSEYIDVEKRVAELGCNIPTGLAILPRNFEEARSRDQLLHEDSTVTIRSLWRQNGIEETRLEGDGKKFPSIDEKFFDWIGPTIFIGGSLLTQNPTLVSIALNVLSNYVTDFFKGHVGTHTVSISLVLEDVKRLGDAEERISKKVTFKGTVDELNKLDADSLKKFLK